MMLAEITNSDVVTWQIVFTMTTIAANIAIIIGTRQKQKREVSFEFTPASKEEFDAHTESTRENFAALRTEQKQDRHDNQVHASQRSTTLFNKVESIRTELDSKIEDTRRELMTKIDDVPDRVIATLKNTGAI